jgi:hypothetical protein
MGPDKCAYHQNKCLIYQIRPKVCQNYYCAWVQGLFPEWMRPDKCGLLISVENWPQGQYLRAIATQPIKDDVTKELEAFCNAQNCPVILIFAGGNIQTYGSDDFTQYIKTKHR